MAKIKVKEVHRQAYALGTSNTNVDIPKDNMPSGLIHGFSVILESAAVTTAGGATTNYQKILAAATYGSSTPNWNPMTGVPGLVIDRYNTIMFNKASSRVAPVAGGFRTSYYLPFSWRGSVLHPYMRPKDSGLLNIKNQAAPSVNLQLGAYTDLDANATACTVTVILLAHYEENPRPGFGIGVGGGDQPSMMLEFSVKQKSDISTNPIAKLLYGGGRFNLAVGLRELNSSTSAEVSDIFTTTRGSGSQSKFEIVKGSSDNYTPRMKVPQLDVLAEDYFGSALAAGVHLWMASMNTAGKAGQHGADSIPLDDTFELQSDNLNTTATRLWEILQVNHIQLPQDVRDQHASWLGVAAAK